MMRIQPLLLSATILALAVTASAADISGTWKGTAHTPAGTSERTFNFKVDGNRLTGDTTSDLFGKSAIEDGKIDGGTITFTLTVSIQGQENKVNYTGKVEGDQINFTVEIPAFNQKLEYSVKRVKESHTTRLRHRQQPSSSGAEGTLGPLSGPSTAKSWTSQSTPAIAILDES